MINGLGGTPISELYLLYGIAHQKLADQGINVFRSYVNEYCTSLEMAGASLTLLKVDDELKEPAAGPGRDLVPGVLGEDRCPDGRPRRRPSASSLHFSAELLDMEPSELILRRYDEER